MPRLSMPTALGALAFVFSAAAQANVSPLDELSRDAGQMSHQAIRVLQERSSDAAAIESWIKIDPTVKYGNHTGLMASNGTMVNNVLASHSAVPNRLQPCGAAGNPALDAGIRTESLRTCLGNLKELSGFGIIDVDTKKLDDMRYKLAALTPSL